MMSFPKISTQHSKSSFQEDLIARAQTTGFVCDAGCRTHLTPRRMGIVDENPFSLTLESTNKFSLVAWLRIPGMLIQHGVFCFIWETKNRCNFNTNDNYNNYCNIQCFVLTYSIGRPLIFENYNSPTHRLNHH